MKFCVEAKPAYRLKKKYEAEMKQKVVTCFVVITFHKEIYLRSTTSSTFRYQQERNWEPPVEVLYFNSRKRSYRSVENCNMFKFRKKTLQFLINYTLSTILNREKL